MKSKTRVATMPRAALKQFDFAAKLHAKLADSLQGSSRSEVIIIQFRRECRQLKKVAFSPGVRRQWRLESQSLYARRRSSPAADSSSFPGVWVKSKTRVATMPRAALKQFDFAAKLHAKLADSLQGSSRSEVIIIPRETSIVI